MDAVDTFYKVTKLSISNFFSDFKYFTDNYYTSYVGYYRGISTLDSGIQVALNSLVDTAEKIEELFFINRDSLSKNTESWDLYEVFSDCYNKIQTIKNTPKWTRSSYSNGYNKDIQVDFILKQNELPEDLSNNLGYSSPQDDWVDLAINNNLKETDYDISGGGMLRVSFAVNTSLNSSSVVDVMIGDNVVGKDIDQNIVIDDNDLSALTPKDTVTQAVNILTNVTTGSVPEFPRDGVDSSLIGTNVKAVQYPIIFRQLTSIFKKDDTFKSVEIMDISQEQDSIVMTVNVTSKLNDVINQNIYLNE